MAYQRENNSGGISVNDVKSNNESKMKAAIDNEIMASAKK
jgi:hypothetical protein